MNNVSEEKIRECTHLFMSTDRQHRTCCERLINQLGIHRSQHMLLMHLSRIKNTPCQKQIAEEFDISPSAVAVTLSKLERNGYIKRTSSLNDSRFNEIVITDNGKDIVKKSSDIFKKIDNQMFKYLDEDEIIQMTKYLNKIKLALCELNKEESV